MFHFFSFLDILRIIDPILLKKDRIQNGGGLDVVSVLYPVKYDAAVFIFIHFYLS